ncbi:SdrD B-like domain-containing protein [Novipirellula artificiosorum]|uniref:Serine-aspartate repeat-containing protein D n=1 Tax=Novipirellula artificiosorum TaxID=2528016 RepID=A0A5C6DAT2_9BACT|nr:SdrD B-like domain-containing protein [Novipirellula artificiosorum]TWU31969.1 Serine-aspartate repeat-containing protein D precursor [Novipirellula artificiosorum]
MRKNFHDFVHARLWQHLEPRVLFDAAPNVEVSAEQGDAAQNSEPEVAIVSIQQETVAATSDKQADGVNRELVIVDASVENYQLMVDDLLASEDPTREFEVVVIGEAEDGIARLSAILATQSDLDGLHLISHGEDGAFRLGNTWVNGTSLQANAGAISAWGDALNDTGDILLYGCDVSASQAGRDLVDGLAALTQQQVAASENDTGAAAHGGDWTLEYANGNIETEIAMSEETQAEYTSVLAAGPEASLSADQNVMLGENFTFSVTFDNTGADTGFGPYIDLLMPASGADGSDGVTLTGASYLGQTLNVYEHTFIDSGDGTETIAHPYFVDSSGTPLQVKGNAGDILYVVELPFGSVTPGQPPISVELTGTVSSDADLGTPLIIQTRSGFRYGEDALDNPTTDPSIVIDNATDLTEPFAGWTETMRVTPTLMTLKKDYIGPENETATGPNYVRQYRIGVDVASGQAISNLEIIDRLPNNIVITSIDSVTVGGSAATYSDNLGSITQPGNAQDLIISLTDQVVGTTAEGDVMVTVSFYVPEFDADGNRIIPLNGEDDTVSNPDSRSLNNARAVGDWTPTDAGDASGTGNAIADPDSVNPEHILDDKAIALQKSVAVVGGGDAIPGAILEYTLSFQISDYYTFGDLVIDDVFQDGQLFDFGYGATFNIGDFSNSANGSFSVRSIGDADTGETLVVDETKIDLTDNGSENVASDGSTTLRFDISQAFINQLTTDGASNIDGILQGGLTNGATNLGAAAGTITFRTVIQEDYADTFPSADRSVDQGDVITNDSLTITGSVRQNVEDGTINTVLLPAESDGSSASIQIATGTLNKEVYAINGNTSLPMGDNGLPVLVAGDVVTYRITYSLPTSDFEDLTLSDFLPLPIFEVGDHNADGVGGDVWTIDFSNQTLEAVSGTIELGANDDFFAESNITPTINLGVDDNRLTLEFGDYDDINTSPNTIELYLSVTAQDAPTADGLFLTNVVQGSEGTTQLESTSIDDIVQIEVTQPVLEISKGIIAVNNSNASLTGSQGPSGISFAAVGSTGVPFSGGAITSDGLASGAIDANASGLDAGDRIRYAIVIENTGNSSRGAYDVTIADSLPSGLSLVAGSLQVVNGTGATVAFTGTEADLFTTGITLDDPSATQGAIEQYNSTSGDNIIVLFYEAEVSSTIPAASTKTNTAAVTHFAGREGGEDHTPTDLTETATVSVDRPTISKTLSGTEIDSSNNGANQVVIGEYVDYQIVVSVPEGTMGNFRVADVLDPGLVYVNGSATITPSIGLATSEPSFASIASGATVNAAGTSVTFDFGTITNSNTDNATSEQITITLRAIVSNVASNDTTTNDLNNRATLSYDSGPNLSNTSANVTVLEPAMSVDVTSNVSTADVGNVIEYTITVTNHALSTGSDAYDVNLEDIVPAGLTYVTSSLTHDSGIIPTAFGESGGTISANWSSFAEGGSSTFTFQATGNASMTTAGVSNAADISWTSLPGDQTAPRSTHSTVSTERTGDTANPGTSENDYVDSDSAFIAFPITPSKVILSTSESHTGDASSDTAADPRELAIGEIVMFELRTVIGEGTLNNVVFRDLMTEGLTLLPATVTFEIIADSNMTVDAGLSGANSGSITLPAGRITTTGTSTQQIDFDLGNIVNNDNDAGAEELVITFQALVTNDSANHDGDAKTNRFEFIEGGSTRATSGTVNAEIVEPEITNVNKRVRSTNATGTEVTYQITFANTGNSSAFDVSVRDSMAAELTLQMGTISVTHTGAVSAVNTTNSNATELDIRIGEMQAGSTITVEYAVTVAYASSAIQNDADVTYTSLPGDQGTANATPGSSGAADGERNGSEIGVNDYADSESAFLGSISDHVYYDINGDGSDNGSDVGIPGVTVNLIWFGVDGIEGNSDDVTRTTTTNASGDYLFTTLPAGSFRVSVDSSSLPNGINEETFDLDGTGTANTSVMTLTDSLAGIIRDDADFGYTGSAQLGDLVYLDLNGDGDQDAGEMGLANVDILLTWHGFDGALGGGDDITYTQTTNNDGEYNFTRLPAGTFTVDLVNSTAPAGTVVTTSNDTHNVTLTEGQDNDDSDFGLRGPGNVGDFVFFDSNNNGVYDVSVDSAYPGVTVTWTADIDGDSVDESFSTTTDNSGAYHFEGLPLDTFTIAVTPPVGTTPTFDATGIANNLSTATLTLGTPTDNDQDFGLTGTGRVGDIVFWDYDANGAQNGSEVGLAGIQVQLEIDLNQDGSNEITLTQTTASDGSYLFDKLPPGAYTVVVAQPTGSVQTADADGLASGNESSLVLNAGQVRDDQDFGYNGTGSIGDLVFFDYRGDGGVFNAGEGDRGMGGVDVTLEVDVNGDSVTDFTLNTTTAGDGSYRFDHLVAGDYTITVDSADLPDQMGANPTYDANGSGTADVSEIALAGGATNNDQDFGYHAVPNYNIVIDDGQTSVDTGQTLNYTVTVRNDGTLRGNNAVVTVAFPNDLLESVAASTGGIVDDVAGTVTWNSTTTPELAVMNVGEQVVFTITADVVEILDGSHSPITLTADVTDDLVNGIDPDLADNTNNDVDQIANIQTLKNVTGVSANGDNWDVTFVITVENTGSVRLDQLSLVDDIASQFGAALVSVTAPILDGTGITAGTTPTTNPNWATDPSLDILDPANASEYFLPGESYTISYTVTLDPDFSGTSFEIDNSAIAGGVDITTDVGNPFSVIDLSDSGVDVTTTNPGGPGDQGSEDDPTPIYIPDVSIAKIQTGALQDAVTRNYTVGFTLFVENIGTVTLDQLSLLDDVAAQFGNAFVSIEASSLVMSHPTGTGVFPVVNTAWETDTTAQMIDATGASLDAGASFEISFNVIVDPDGIDGLSQELTNQATAAGRGLDESGAPLLDGGIPIITTDLSDSGANANTNNLNEPGDSTGNDDPTPVVLPEIGVAKRLVSSVASVTNGNRDLTYELVVRNLGTVDLVDLSLLEDLDAQFGSAFVGVVSAPVLFDSTALVDPNLAAWDGEATTDMFDGTSGVLRPGEEFKIRFTIEANIDSLDATSNNQVVVLGDWDVQPGVPGINGTVSDLSDTGTDPTGNNPGNPGDSGGFDDPTLVPAIGIAKDHGNYVELLDVDGFPTGHFVFPTSLVIENLGATELTHLNLRDDIAGIYGDAFVAVDNLAIVTTGVTGTAPTLNLDWLDDTTQNLLASGLLNPGDTFTVMFDVTLDPDANGGSGYFDNQATIVGSDPLNALAMVQDFSDSGLDPASNNLGEPGDTATADDPTPVAIPDLGLAKQVIDAKQKGLSFELTIELVLQNTGTVDLNQIELRDDIADQYGSNFGRILGAPVIIASTATSTPTLNAGYATDTTQAIFDGTDGFMKPGESVTIRLVVEVISEAGQTEVVVVNQATTSADPLDENGNPLEDNSGTPIGRISDLSDSGADATGHNPGAPGNTGHSDDPTPQPLTFFTFDAYNDFSQGKKGLEQSTKRDASDPFDDGLSVNPDQYGSRGMLTQQITRLAPEPIFSGSARPGTQVIGRVFDSAGRLVGEELSLADVGGNWMMQFHQLSSQDHARIEFVELPGTSDAFSTRGDIYGYLGMDSLNNDYASLEPWTFYDQSHEFTAIYRPTVQQSLLGEHQRSTRPLGLGR